MAAYIVSVVTSPAELVVCELYASYNLAASKALTLARNCANSNPEWVSANPSEEKLEDGSVRWTFLETSKFLVSVHFKQVKNDLLQSNALDNLRNNSNFIKYGDTLKVNPVQVNDNGTLFGGVVTVVTPQVVTQVVVPVVPVVQDNPWENTLPGGFSLAGKPITLEDLKNDPYNCQNPNVLTENQKWAVATARVRKREGFSFNDAGTQVSRQTALDEMQKKTALGTRVMVQEIAFLEMVYFDATDESSSSSEESDY